MRWTDAEIPWTPAAHWLLVVGDSWECWEIDRGLWIKLICVVYDLRSNFMKHSRRIKKGYDAKKTINILNLCYVIFPFFSFHYG